MGADWGNAILSGLLGGLGGFGTQVGAAAESQRQEALRREQLAIEQQRADQLVTMQQKQLAQQQSQFEATQRGNAIPVADLFGYLGLPIPKTIAPDARIPNAVADNLLKTMETQRTRERETTQQTRVGALLDQAQGQPSRLMGQLAEGEDPEAAAMIPRSPNVPPMETHALAGGLRRLGEKPTEIAALLKILRPEAEGDAFAPLSENAPGLYNKRTGATQMFPTPAPASQEKPQDRPGFQWVQSLDKGGKATWREEPIGSGTDLDGEARARGYGSFAQAPDTVRMEIKRYSDDKSLRVSRGQGADAVTAKAAAERGLPLAQMNLHGGMVWDRQQSRPADPLNTSAEDARRDPGRFVVIDKDKQMPQLTAIGESKILLSQFVPLVQGLTNQPMANFAQAAEMWAKTKAGVDNPGVAFDAMKGTILRMAGAMQGSRVQLSDQDRKAVEGMLPTPMDTAQTGMKRLQTVQRILDSMEAALVGDTNAVTQANVLLRQIGGTGTLGGGAIPGSVPPAAAAPTGGGWSIKRVQ